MDLICIASTHMNLIIFPCPGMTGLEVKREMSDLKVPEFTEINPSIQLREAT
jgi:hypothetical protein